MFLDIISEEVLRAYRDEHFHFHCGDRVILYHHTLTVEKLSNLQNGVLKYAFLKGVREIVYQEKKLYDLKGRQLDAVKKVGKGTYGEVVLLTYFNVVAKLAEDLKSQLSEVAVYNLIRASYPEPEKVGLPRILSYSHGCLILPHYGEELGLNRDDTVLKKVGTALTSLHSLGIVHRDLKPSNILYNKGDPIIVDFGLACWHIFTRPREGNTSIQSMYYRSPEVCLRVKSVSYPSDWWSYGVILASRRKHLYTPSTNAELHESLRRLFGLSQLTRFELGLERSPKFVPDKAQEFLCLNPQQRGGQSVVLPSLLPVASLLHTHSVKTTRYLLGEVRSWLSFFAATEYCARTSPGNSAGTAGVLYDRDTFSDVSFDNLASHLYELNTYTLCLLKYSKKVWYLRPCLILALRGTQFPHRDQAQWIEDEFFNLVPDTYPKIKEVYQSNELLLAQFQLPEKLSTYFEDM